MRLERHLSPSERTHDRKVKIKIRKSNIGFSLLQNFLTPNLENIDENFQVDKDHNDDCSKRTWKIVPKDSCEVYKDRMRRKEESLRRERDSQSDSPPTKVRPRVKRRKTRKRIISRRKKARRLRSRCRSQWCCCEDASMGSSHYTYSSTDGEQSGREHRGYSSYHYY